MKRLILSALITACCLTATAKTPKPAPTPQPSADDYRTWTSADGKHTTEAKLTKAEPDAAVLTTKDGKEVTVKTPIFPPPIERSSATRSYRTSAAPIQHGPSRP